MDRSGVRVERPVRLAIYAKQFDLACIHAYGATRSRFMNHAIKSMENQSRYFAEKPVVFLVVD